jgi:hypothetical protein
MIDSNGEFSPAARQIFTRFIVEAVSFIVVIAFGFFLPVMIFVPLLALGLAPDENVMWIVAFGWYSIGPAVFFSPLLLTIREFNLFGRLWFVAVGLAFLLSPALFCYFVHGFSDEVGYRMIWWRSMPWLSLAISLVLGVLWPSRRSRNATSDDRAGHLDRS